MIDFLAYGFGNQSLVAALGGSTILICNVAVSHFWHKEVVYRSDVLGCILVLVGSCWFAATAENEENPSVEDIAENFQRVQFEVFVLIQSFFVCIALGTIANTKMYEWRASLTRKLLRPVVRDFRRQNDELRLRVEKLERQVKQLRQDVDYLENLQAEEKPHAYEPSVFEDGGLNEIARQYRHWTDCYVYAATAGMVGSFAILFAGVVSKLLLHDTVDALQAGFFYASLGGMGICLIFQIQLLNRGLETGDVMVVLPVFQAFWITFGVVSGIVFYHRGAISLPGLLFVIVGVVAFLRHGRKEAGKKTAHINSFLW